MAANLLGLKRMQCVSDVGNHLRSYGVSDIYIENSLARSSSVRGNNSQNARMRTGTAILKMAF